MKKFHSLKKSLIKLHKTKDLVEKADPVKGRYFNVSIPDKVAKTIKQIMQKNFTYVIYASPQNKFIHVFRHMNLVYCHHFKITFLMIILLTHK